MHMLVRAELARQRIRKHIFQRPVGLTFSYNARLDCSNYGYITKLIEDALKGYFIKDDSRKYVHYILQQFWDGDGIKVEIREVTK
jgi:Holliday junction resolvase RusA-like endonuclease